MFDTAKVRYFWIGRRKMLEILIQKDLNMFYKYRYKKHFCNVRIHSQYLLYYDNQHIVHHEIIKRFLLNNNILVFLQYLELNKNILDEKDRNLL